MLSGRRTGALTGRQIGARLRKRGGRSLPSIARPRQPAREGSQTEFKRDEPLSSHKRHVSIKKWRTSGMCATAARTAARAASADAGSLRGVEGRPAVSLRHDDQESESQVEVSGSCSGGSVADESRGTHHRRYSPVPPTTMGTWPSALSRVS